MFDQRVQGGVSLEAHASPAQALAPRSDDENRASTRVAREGLGAHHIHRGIRVVSLRDLPHGAQELRVSLRRSWTVSRETHALLARTMRGL